MLMWWTYFNIGAERASHEIVASTDPGALARLAYTYIHLPLVAGIIVAAVADELILAHPTEHIGTAAAVLGGPALYLIGNILFKGAISGGVTLSHLVGLLLLALLVSVSAVASALTLGAGATLVVVGAWETASPRRVRAEPIGT